MTGKKHIIVLLTMMTLLCLAAAVSGQSTTAGTLTMGQPSVGTIIAGETRAFTYTLAEPRVVTLQALGDSVAPTLTVFQQGEVVAEAPNEAGNAILTLNTFLPAGTYTVETGIVGEGTGTVVLVVQSETPIEVQPLPPATPITGSVSAETPIAIFSFDALPEQAYLYVDSGTPDETTSVRLVNTTTQRVSGVLGADMLGARLRIPANGAAYQLEIIHEGSDLAAPYSLCLVPVSQGDCTGEAPATAVAVTAEAPDAACTVSSSVGGPVNIRQSATTAATIIGALPVGSSAAVLGISPNGQFYNIQFNAINGWVSLSVVTASGTCANLPTVNPPPVVPQPTLPPTLAPTQPATDAPTQPPPPTPTPSGPCLISVVAPVYVYQIPVEQVDYLHDQVMAGGQLIPTGRLADNSWWKTNYGGTWIQTMRFGNEVTVSGDCSSLPVITP